MQALTEIGLHIYA